MDPRDFTNEKPGELIKNLQGEWTFVPTPLPGRLRWTNDLVSALADASAALGRVQSMSQWKFLDARHLLRLFLRREAELSSRIENTYADVQAMLLYEQSPAIEAKVPDVREVENNFKALEYGLAAVEHRPITLSLIKEMHQILLTGVRGSAHTPGQFRQVQAHIGGSHRIEEARFVPAPAHEVEPSMRELERYIQQPDDLPALIRLAMIHYQFEAIHPFSDGNGRIGRVLILMLMCTENVLPIPLLNPSAPLERGRSEYYDHLLAVSQRGAWTEWAAFFVRGIADEARATIDRIQRLDALRQRYLEQLSAVRASPLASKLVDRLFAEPSVTLQQVAGVLNTSKPSAQNLIDRFVKAGILRETTGQRRNRIYLAQEIVDQLRFSADTQNPEGRLRAS